MRNPARLEARAAIRAHIRSVLVADAEGSRKAQGRRGEGQPHQTLSRTEISLRATVKASPSAGEPAVPASPVTGRAATQSGCHPGCMVRRAAPPRKGRDRRPRCRDALGRSGRVPRSNEGRGRGPGAPRRRSTPRPVAPSGLGERLNFEGPPRRASTSPPRQLLVLAGLSVTEEEAALRVRSLMAVEGPKRASEAPHLGPERGGRSFGGSWPPPERPDPGPPRQPRHR